NELAEQLQSPASRTQAAEGMASGDLSPLLEATFENLRETFRHLSAKQIVEIVDRLAARRGHLYLVGGRFTDPIARYMAAHMTVVQPNVFHLSGQESLWRDRLI